MLTGKEAVSRPPSPVTVDQLRPVLGSLTRGLSALFWGLPLALVLSVQALTPMRLASVGLLNLLAPSAGFGLLLYGLALLGALRVSGQASWLTGLDRARFVAMTCLGLSPFLHFYQRVPRLELFAAAVLLLGFFSLVLLVAINQLLRSLAELLPDGLLRLETRAFTRLNSACAVALPVLAGAWYWIWQWAEAPLHVRIVLQWIEPFRLLILLFLTLLPISMTMSLVWKAKETLLNLCAGSSPDAAS